MRLEIRNGGWCPGAGAQAELTTGFQYETALAVVSCLSWPDLPPDAC